jgi:Restriction endonuclease
MEDTLKQKKLNTCDEGFLLSILPYVREDKCLRHDNGNSMSLDDIVRVSPIGKGKCWSIIRKLTKEKLMFTESEGKQKKYFADISLILTKPESSLTKRYQKYINSKQWVAKRKQVFQRDNYECQKCKSKEELRAHHLTYEHFGDEPLEDLITLCNPCHNEIHYRKKRD